MTMNKNKDQEVNLENILTNAFFPVKPREEFIGKLRHQLEEEVLPIQSKKNVGFQDLFHDMLEFSIIIFVLLLLIRAILIIISTINFYRKNKLQET
ncbi:MAG: hypothetical protein ACPL3P_04445 [Anaerolineales bacterium]